VTIFLVNLYLSDLLYFYLCTLITGPPLIPVFITLMGLSCTGILLLLVLLLLLLLLLILLLLLLLFLLMDGQWKITTSSPLTAINCH